MIQPAMARKGSPLYSLFLNNIVADELQGCLITCIKKEALKFFFNTIS